MVMLGAHRRFDELFAVRRCSPIRTLPKPPHARGKPGSAAKTSARGEVRRHQIAQPEIGTVRNDATPNPWANAMIFSISLIPPIFVTLGWAPSSNIAA
jgi:hypothetical protein